MSHAFVYELSTLMVAVQVLYLHGLDTVIFEQGCSLPNCMRQGLQVS